MPSRASSRTHLRHADVGQLALDEQRDGAVGDRGRARSSWPSGIASGHAAEQRPGPAALRGVGDVDDVDACRRAARRREATPPPLQSAASSTGAEVYGRCSDRRSSAGRTCRAGATPQHLQDRPAAMLAGRPAPRHRRRSSVVLVVECGSSTMTRATTRGCFAGTKPTNDVWYSQWPFRVAVAPVLGVELRRRAGLAGDAVALDAAPACRCRPSTTSVSICAAPRRRRGETSWRLGQPVTRLAADGRGDVRLDATCRRWRSRRRARPSAAA